VETRFLTLRLALPPEQADLAGWIETQLRHHGEPLRWAIAAVESGQVCLEAVVTIRP
jgi:hypothetical protein